MNTLDSLPVQPRRRRHSAAFKAQVIAASQQPGVSIAAIAREHNLNDNLIHKWLRQIRMPNPMPSQARAGHPNIEFVRPALPLIPVRVTESPVSKDVIHLELRQQDLALTIDWPAAQTITCIQFLQGLLR